QAALVSITPDGALKAIVGGRSYEDSQFNRATDAMRQPGSAFKPFVYLAALLNGYTPDSVVYDAPITIGTWTARNYAGKYAGRTNLTTALTHSYNTVPLHLMRAIGRKAILDTARDAGITSRLLSVPSMPLGSNEVTVMDMAQGYAAFASGGLRAQVHAVTEIKRADGKVIYAREETPRQRAFPEDKVAELNQMMSSVVERGTGRRALLGFEPQAGKTGTTSSYRDAWFVGYTAQLVTAVWYGNDDYSEMNRLTGGTLPALTWQRYSTAALQGSLPMPLAGLPLDERYTMLSARTDLNLPEIPLEQGRGAALANAELPPDTAPPNVKSRANAEQLVPSFRNLFGLFANPPAKTRKKKSPSFFDLLRSGMER
ncbi:MAG: penicillin-binding transpeptidase domain-containing protein, partial [Aestuariivirgaceae bacterium]|nr:penicillin-binding transpeptidase domain-containing protein [Aestuariivirgaceae bacterium]